MARFNFRHGIARRQEDGVGNPTFLTPSNGGANVDLIVSPDPTIFIIAHFDEDYLVAENATVSQAWGPFVSGTDYWLYWDVDFITGELTRASTTLEPVVQVSAPSSPAVDQHWFDTSQNVMKVWSGSSWVEKIRLFAAEYRNGATLVPEALGSQIGVTGTTVFAGSILSDPDGNPLQKFQRNRRGQFITTETPLNSQLTRISNFRVEAAIIQAEATETINIHTAVAYSDYNELVLARNTVPGRPAVGIASENMNPGEIRSFITKGFITNEVDWDWSAYDVGTPLFVGATGELTPTPPLSGSLQQVAIVVDPTTVFVNIQPLYRLQQTAGGLVVHFDRSTGELIASEQSLGRSLDGLDDVTITGSPPIADGEILVFDFATQQWVNQPNTGGGTSQFNYDSTLNGGAATTHTVAHNLGQQFVNVTVYRQAGSPVTYEQILPLSVVLDSQNQLTVTFSSPTECIVVVTGEAGVSLS